MKKGQKIATLIIVFVALLLGLVVVAILPQSIDYRQKLDKANALMKTEGMPMDIAGLAAVTKVPEQSNAGPLYVQAYGLLSKDDARGPQSLRLQAPIVDSPAAETAELKRLEPALALTAKAANLPNCVFSKDYSKGVGTLMPEYSYMRSLEQWTIWRARIELQRGQTAEALTDLGNVLKISNHCVQTPFFIGALVGVAMRREELIATWPEMDTKPLSASRIEALIKIDQAPLKLNLKRSYMAEYPLMLATLDAENPNNLIKGYYGSNDQKPPLNVQLQAALNPTLLKLQWKADFADAIANLIGALPIDGSIAGLDTTRSKAIEATYRNDTSPAAFLVNIADPGSLIDSMKLTYTTFVAAQRMHWLGAQLLLGHKPKTEWPTTPPSYWQKVNDPTSGKPFVYTKTKSGFEIMSSNPKESEESRMKLEYPIPPEHPPQAMKPPANAPSNFPHTMVPPSKRLSPPKGNFALKPED